MEDFGTTDASDWSIGLSLRSRGADFPFSSLRSKRKGRRRILVAVVHSPSYPTGKYCSYFCLWSKSFLLYLYFDLCVCCLLVLFLFFIKFCLCGFGFAQLMFGSGNVFISFFFLSFGDRCKFLFIDFVDWIFPGLACDVLFFYRFSKFVANMVATLLENPWISLNFLEFFEFSSHYPNKNFSSYFLGEKEVRKQERGKESKILEILENLK